MTSPISEATIRHHANTQSFSRGADYCQQGAVTDLLQRGNTIQAEVEGSEVQPYRVSLAYDSGGITVAKCTCPYNYDGWCKHIVAAALTWVKHPDRLEQRPTLPQLLDRLDHRQTQHLVQALVAEHPDLINAVDRHTMLISNPTPPAKTAAPRRQTKLDATPFRRQVKQILRDGLRSLEEGYDEEDPFTDDLLIVIDKALAFARQEDGNSAIAILEAITAACVDEWDDVSDYGGDSAIAEALDEAWTEAILSADLASPDGVDLQVMLEDWQDALGADFSMSLGALEQGWDDPDLQQILQGKGTRNIDPDRWTQPFAQDLAFVRLQILDRQGREQEYLHLARAEGLTLQYLTRLAELGNIDEAMAAAREHMATAEEAFALAKVLRESNHLPEALEIAQAGLPLPGNCRYALATWTSELAEGLGNSETALEGSILAFQVRPSFSDYQRVERLAAEQWDSIKPELLGTLRHSQAWEARDAKVDIYLHEGLLDHAIQTVQDDNYYRSETVHRVMEAVVATHPNWVIEAARKRAEAIMDQGKADRYQEAVHWLNHVKAAYLQLEQRSQWVDYFKQLQSTHGRKRKLMDLFKQLF
jgi:uncharacterized Zn finger protein